MAKIPPESRAALIPLLSIVSGARSRNFTNKELGTLQSRQEHFIKFLLKFKIGNNVALKGYHQHTRNIIMACYTANLASGENLLCKTIKSGTIIRYLSAAAELSIQLNTISPLLDITGKRSKYVTDVLNEIKRWEQVPNRREPLTKSMINYIIKKGKSFSTNINDNLYSAIGDRTSIRFSTQGMGAR